MRVHANVDKPLAILSIGLGSSINFFPMAWAVAMSILLLALMNISRGPVKKLPAAETADPRPPE